MLLEGLHSPGDHSWDVWKQGLTRGAHWLGYTPSQQSGGWAQPCGGHRWGPLAPQDLWPCWGNRGRGAMAHEAGLQTRSTKVRHPCPHPPARTPRSWRLPGEATTRRQAGSTVYREYQVDGDAAPACWAQLCTRHACLAEPSPSAYPFYR